MTFTPIPCKCKDCTNFSACVEYSKYLIENNHQSDTPQNLTLNGRSSDVFAGCSDDVSDTVSNYSILERLISKFTKRDKKNG